MKKQNKISKNISFRSELGASLVEYTLGVSLLAVIFLAGNSVLQEAGEQSAAKSASTATGMVPCIWVDGVPQGLLGDNPGNVLECM